jgi:hypothetical protein
VSTFGLVDIPVERAEALLFVRRAVEPDVETNASGLDAHLSDACSTTCTPPALRSVG